MKSVIFSRPAVRANFDPGAGLYSDQMLAELLVLHEEMVAQLRRERQDSLGTTNFLSDMIVQHEKAAMMLRAQLENREARSRPEFESPRAILSPGTEPGNSSFHHAP